MSAIFMIALMDISIHAPHARSDGLMLEGVKSLAHFNPRSSCEERLANSLAEAVNYKFQSTLLMRGAT